MHGQSGRCHAPRRDGTPCRAAALDGDYCFAHSPARADQRAQARRQGGLNRANAVRLRALVLPRLIPIFDALERAIEEVHSGAVEPARVTAMATTVRALVAVLTAGELEERVRRVEEKTAVES
jgi:hypothetical protein